MLEACHPEGEQRPKDLPTAFITSHGSSPARESWIQSRQPSLRAAVTWTCPLWSATTCRRFCFRMDFFSKLTARIDSVSKRVSEYLDDVKVAANTSSSEKESGNKLPHSKIAQNHWQVLRSLHARGRHWHEHLIVAHHSKSWRIFPPATTLE